MLMRAKTRSAKHPPRRMRSSFSPYQVFTRAEWSRLRADTPMMLSQDELDELSGITDKVSIPEVEEVYLPLSRLLNLHVRTTQELHRVRSRFLGRNDGKMPFIIGLAGSVAVGKSTTARVLQALLTRWPEHPHVDLVPTDGFLLSNAELEARGIMNRKGFPESYDTPRLLDFLGDVKSGRHQVEAPVYSHVSYDVLPGERIVVDQPDILIVEGLNVLQPARLPRHGEAIPFVSDFFDFSIYIDADAGIIERWYVERFLRLRETAFQETSAYFHRYARLNDEEARERALQIWRSINLVNLSENILPTRQRASLILTKDANHQVERVDLRKT